jgi:hypothetical protein
MKWFERTVTLKSIAQAFLFLLSTLLIVSHVYAKGWRGIIPLHSTRAEVEKLWGPPTERQTDYSDFYRTKNETIIIEYASGLPCGIGGKHSQWRVPRGTVESIYITPNMDSPLSQLTIDQSKYQKRSGGHRPEDIYYINGRDGETLRVFQNKVMDITYSPTAGDEHLRCAAMTRSSRKNCEGVAPPRFDTYGEISRAQEKQRLDNFVISLMGQKGSAGYIISYAGKRARLGEAIGRAQRARNYLIKVRSFPPRKLKGIDGGHREESAVDLYIVAPGDCPPEIDPTVDPRDVQIVKPAWHNGSKQ